MPKISNIDQAKEHARKLLDDVKVENLAVDSNGGIYVGRGDSAALFADLKDERVDLFVLKPIEEVKKRKTQKSNT